MISMFGMRHSAFPDDLVLYQIYPRSFQDSNNDGVGDLPGIIRRLDYLVDLGINAIWLSPTYPSPMVDAGYDISDYTAVDPLFGTQADLDALVSEAHKRGIRVLLDFVANHTSDQHPWFTESRSSLDNPKRDWYFWREGQDSSKPPNNWLSVFGGSAWTYDKLTKQYYLHSFSTVQPDLNWRNPAVRDAFKSVMRFWLDRGIDGFRIDAANWYGKDPQFRDDPENLAFNANTDSPYERLLHYHSSGQPELFDYLCEMTNVLKPYHNRFMVIEAHFDMLFDVHSYANFYQHIDASVAAPFNFIDLYLPWSAETFQRFIDDFQASLRPSDVPVYTAGNHDRSRLASRIGEDATRAAAVLFLTLPGVPVIYYGEEIGMEDVVIKRHATHDIYGKNIPGMGVGRDPERTPMQWSAEKYAGFSSHTPWLPVSPDHIKRNVTSEARNPGSLLNLYKFLLRLRAHSAALQKGKYIPLKLAHPDTFGYIRTYRKQKLAIVINFSRSDTAPCIVRGKLVVSTYGDAVPSETLAPLEARIIQL